MNAETVEVNGIIYQTLKSIFLFVQVAPGERNYFIASDAPVGINFARRAELAGLSNDYVNQYYIQDDLLEQNMRRHTAEASPALSAPRHSLRSARVCLQMCPFCRKGTFLFNWRYFITSFRCRQLCTLEEPSSLSFQTENDPLAHLNETESDILASRDNRHRRRYRQPKRNGR